MRDLIRKAIAEAADEPSSIDDIMFNMALSGARSAQEAFRFEDLKRAAANNQTTDLIKWLLSDKPLKRKQRIGLARLLAGDFKSRRGRPPHSDRENRGYDEMIREWQPRVPELAVKEGITKDAARKRIANRLKMDLRAGDKSGNTIERDLRSKPENLAARRQRGGSPKRPRLQKIRLK